MAIAAVVLATNLADQPAQVPLAGRLEARQIVEQAGLTIGAAAAGVRRQAIQNPPRQRHVIKLREERHQRAQRRIALGHAYALAPVRGQVERASEVLTGEPARERRRQALRSTIIC